MLLHLSGRCHNRRAHSRGEHYSVGDSGRFPLMKKPNQTRTPYVNAKSAWQFVNYVHLLASQPAGIPFTLHARSCSPQTLRLRLFGGRQYLTRDDTMGVTPHLVAACNETIITPSGPAGVTLLPTTNFQAAAINAYQRDPYFGLLAQCDLFVAQQGLSSHTIARALPTEQQDGLAHYFSIRPVLKGSMISETLILLRK